MWHAADIAEKLKHSKGFQFTGVGSPKFDWNAFKPQRDAYIHKLNGIYANNFEKEGVEHHTGEARLVSASEVEVTRPDGTKYSLKADNICIATGGRPTKPTNIPGAELGIVSDDFFDLEEQPKRVVVVGGGYIAVELAGVFHALGSEVDIIIRGDRILRSFDHDLAGTLMPWMEHTGIRIHQKTNVKKVEGEKGGPLTVHLDDGSPIEADCLLWAIGRHANTEALELEKLGVKLDKKGDVVVDEYQNSTVKGVTAIGDVQGKALLTPVAIAAGRRLSNRLFGPEKYKNDKLSYEEIPTVVFSYVISMSVVKYPSHNPQTSYYWYDRSDRRRSPKEVWRFCESLQV